MIRLLASTVVVLLLVVPVPASEEKGKESDEGKSDEKEETLTFSNADLERRYGAGTSTKSTESGAKTSTDASDSVATGQAALDKMFADRASSKEKAVKISQAEAAVAAARARVAQLETKRLEVVNPLLPRPAPPEDPAEAERWKAMNGVERANATKAELDAARQALTEAEAALAAARGN